MKSIRITTFPAMTFFIVLLGSPIAVADLTVYVQDFEALDISSAGALGDDGWLVYGNVWEGVAYSTDDPLFSYGPFPAPNYPATPFSSSPGFCGIVEDQGGPDQGLQQLQVFSDYACCGGPAPVHFGPGGTLEANVYQEQVIGFSDVGSTWSFSFSFKESPFSTVSGATTTAAFIKTIDQNDNFSLSNFLQVDTTNAPVTWSGDTISITIDESLVGHLLQFGFLNTASNGDLSTVIYDNVFFLRGLSAYSQDFESLDPNDEFALGDDGWLVYGNVWEGDAYSTDDPLFSYGPFPAPNYPVSIAPGFSGIVTGQGGPDQGLQQLQVFSDYACCGGPAPVHFGPGGTLEANVYQEQVIGFSDVGSTWSFSFSFKESPFSTVSGATTTAAFIKTIDQSDNFSLSNFLTVDTTNAPVTWSGDTISITIDESLFGHLLQFGFLNTASNGDPSTVIYDNVVFEKPTEVDSDGDGIADVQDNCTLVANPDQRDTNGDGFGNICDPDLNNDGIVNFLDISSWVPLFNTPCGDVDADLNGDSGCNFGDYSLFPQYFGQPPGPSAVEP